MAIIEGILEFTSINYLEFFIFITQLLYIELINQLASYHMLIWMDNMIAIL